MGDLINFRDFGGQETRDGRRVQRDRLYRCGHLARVTDADLARVLGLDLALIIDLRYEGERQEEPSPWPLSYADRVMFHGGERSIEAPHLVMLREGSLTPEKVEQFYLEFYRDIPFDPLYRPLFLRSIAQVADSDGRMLVHCAAGKDRTGILCALILRALDVAEDEVVADYLTSGGAPGLMAMKPKIIGRALRRYGHHVSEEAVDALIGVKADYLWTTFATITQREGSLDAYLASGGIDAGVMAKLRRNLLRERETAETMAG